MIQHLLEAPEEGSSALSQHGGRGGPSRAAPLVSSQRAVVPQDL